MAEGISAFQQGGLYLRVSGSYIRILRSDSAVFGGCQFVTLIFGEERREQPHPWERLVPRR